MLDKILLPLTQIIERPDALHIDVLRGQLVARLSQVKLSAPDTAIHGLIRLCLTDKQYKAIAGTEFTAPAHPGPAPASTPTRIPQWNIDNEDFQLYHRADFLCQQLIIAAIKPCFLSALKHPVHEFQKVSTLDMMIHLDNNYGTWTDDAIQRNFDRLNLAWDINTDEPEELWDRISNVQFYAKRAGEPIRDRIAIRETLKFFQTLPYFSEALKEFARETDISRYDMDKFQDFFSQRIRVYKRDHPSSSAPTASTDKPR